MQFPIRLWCIILRTAWPVTRISSFFPAELRHASVAAAFCFRPAAALPPGRWKRMFMHGILPNHFFVCTSCYVMIENKENDFLFVILLSCRLSILSRKIFTFFYFSLIQAKQHDFLQNKGFFLLFRLKNQAFYCAERAEWACFSASVWKKTEEKQLFCSLEPELNKRIFES